MMKNASISKVILPHIEGHSHQLWQVRKGLGQVPETRPLPDYPLRLLIMSSVSPDDVRLIPLATEIFDFLLCQLSIMDPCSF